MSIVIGIDPGITGAIAALSPSGQRVVDMPTMQRGVTTTKQQVNAAALAAVLEDFRGDELRDLIVVVERVMGAPRKTGGGSVMGSASAFNFGHTFGAIEATLQVMKLPYTLVMPATWKKAAKIPTGADKEASRALAIRLFPDMAPHLARKKDVGRAEALLIARFGGEA